LFYLFTVDQREIFVTEDKEMERLAERIFCPATPVN
jgi:hypothetical protein